MAAISDSINLDRLVLSAGEGRRFDFELRPGRLEYGGQSYQPSGETVPARLEISRTATGFAMRLRFEALMQGPCVLCLEPAEVLVKVEAREVEQRAAESEELISPYVDEGELDLAAWSHDALALAMPDRFLCRSECAGLCPVCGASLNDADASEHRHEPPRDPRFARLAELEIKKTED